MELKATSLLLLMCVAVIILTSAGAGTSIIPPCCLRVTKKISSSMLRDVRGYEIQSKSGRCDIDALILHIGSRKICAHPRLKKVLKKLKKNRKPKPAQTQTRNE